MTAAAKAKPDEAFFDRKLYPARQVLFHEGDTADCAWYIEAGRVLVFKTGPGGQTPLGVLAAGEIFGELGLIDDAPRMASVVTLEPTVLLPIARHYIENRVQNSDPFISGLLRILVLNVRSMTDRHVASLEDAKGITDAEAIRVIASLDTA
ncbi:MAG: cyclic nucleotide-binding domain-containing protein [Proteobacteria bacterium]|nr:cyclic nucleotide-binding domain-containing protein [Pseudomonadota bacterium]